MINLVVAEWLLLISQAVQVCSQPVNMYIAPSIVWSYSIL